RVVDSASLMEQTMAHASETPHVLPEVIAQPLRALITRAIAKDPQARFESADEALAALDAALLSLRIETGEGEEPMATARTLEELPAVRGASGDTEGSLGLAGTRDTLEEGGPGETVRLDRAALLSMPRRSSSPRLPPPSAGLP